ncbi:hypothetical protein ACJ41O_002609 [Fusarium nematophilum]
MDTMIEPFSGAHGVNITATSIPSRPDDYLQTVVITSVVLAAILIVAAVGATCIIYRGRMKKRQLREVKTMTAAENA